MWSSRKLYLEFETKARVSEHHPQGLFIRFPNDVWMVLLPFMRLSCTVRSTLNQDKNIIRISKRNQLCATRIRGRDVRCVVGALGVE